MARDSEAARRFGSRHWTESAENRWRRLVPLAVVVAVHVALLAGLFIYQPTRELMVQVIPLLAVNTEPPKPPPPPPKPPPPKPPPPKPVPAQVTPQPPVPAPAITAPAPLITAAPTATAPPTPAAPVAPVTPTPKPPAPAPAAPPATPVASAAPAPVVPDAPARVDPAYKERKEPVYPEMSKRLGQAGRVLLRVQVNATGSVEQVRVETSSGHLRLDQAAMEAVKQWKFLPGTRGGQPVAGPVLVPINFNLDD